MTDVLARAVMELQQSREDPDPRAAFLQRRQAAEKAWLAVVEATDRALGLRVRGPTANQLRRKALRTLDGAVGTRFLDEFDRCQRVLHGSCFYEQQCPEPDVEELFVGIASYEQRLRGAREAVQ